jgi:hypothetical protein
MRLRKASSFTAFGRGTCRSGRAACVVILAVAAAAAIALPVAAHRLAAIGESFPSRADALRIEDPDVSQVAYVKLTAAEPNLWMTFDTVGPFELYVQLGLPALSRLAGHRPSLSVISDSSGEAIATFDTALTVTPRFFHEPFTDTDSWILLEETVAIPAAGTYYIHVSSSPDKAGKVWVAVGQREVFGLSDVFSLPSVIREVRAFHEAGPRGPTSLEWARLLGFVLLGFVLVIAAIDSMQ